MRNILVAIVLLRRCATVVEGRLGRGTTILHCTHRCITTSSQHQCIFPFCFSLYSFIF